MKVAEQLKNQINDKGITYTRISEKIGIPVKTISRIFLGRRKLLSDELFLICKATDINIDDLRKPAS